MNLFFGNTESTIYTSAHQRINNIQVPFSKLKHIYFQVYCRRKIDSKDEEVLLDLNDFAEGILIASLLIYKGKEYLSLQVLDISPDNNVLAFNLDETGEES